MVRSPLRARDTTLMVNALRRLGVVVDDDGTDWAVTPQALSGPADVDCGLAGTVMRFLPPVAALARGPVRFDGAERARQRPMRQLLRALSGLGVDIDDHGRAALPFTVMGHGRVDGGSVTIDASSSSQFVSGLLLAGARYQRGVDVRHQGTPVPSEPHIAMTVDELRHRDVTVQDSEPNRWTVRPGPIRARDVSIEPDLTTAAPFAAAALAAGGRITIPGWPHRTTQPGDRLRDLLPRLGARVELGDNSLVVCGDGQIQGIDVDLRDTGELAPVLAALCALANAPSTLRGIGHLRGHESDRLSALATELSRLGGSVTEEPDGLRITPRPLHGGVFRTYGDHRLVHAAAVIGLRTAGVAVEGVRTATKTHPDFPGAWLALLR